MANWWEDQNLILWKNNFNLVIRSCDSIFWFDLWFDLLISFVIWSFDLSCDSILWFDLVIRSCDSILWFDLVIRSCDSIFWFDLVIQSSDSILWFDLLIWSCDSILWNLTFRPSALFLVAEEKQLSLMT